MINIYLSDMAYVNDVYPLVKAFYPEHAVKVLGAEKSGEQGNSSAYKNKSQMHKAENNEKKTGGKEPELHINFTENRLIITIVYADEPEKTNVAQMDASLSKPQYKNAVKRFLYGILSAETGKKLPWGILTGIRPTKLVYEMLEEKLEAADIHERMGKEYLCSDEKTEMSIRIARRELELLTEMDYRNGYSLYIGIPFCPSTCLYCSFTSYSVAQYTGYVEKYLEALKKELAYGAGCLPDKKLTTVYFGGGTPTTLTAVQLDILLKEVKSNFDFSHVKEFCVEAGRPDSITKDKLEILKKWGVNRISINPQSMQQKTLDLIGRKHTVEDVNKAFQLARETGHDNINMDIIIGLPGENPQDVADTLRQIETFNPESLTVHTLALKRAARLNLKKDDYEACKAVGVTGMLKKTVEFAKAHSYLPYYLYRQKNMSDNLENIGYSKYGKEGLYNILIMEEKQTILALGAGAMSKFVFHGENRIERVDNVKSLTDYIDRIDEMIQRKQNFINENHVRL